MVVVIMAVVEEEVVVVMVEAEIMAAVVWDILHTNQNRHGKCDSTWALQVREFQCIEMNNLLNLIDYA